MAPGVKRHVFRPIVCVVDFHHARGPEVERWIGPPPTHDPALQNDWTLLPFMALSDGAHSATQNFSYFTLRKAADDASWEHPEGQPATSLFGISCTRQIDARDLIVKPESVTRSTVQKAVVVISGRPEEFGRVKEKLAGCTRLWFEQRDFTDISILEDFQASLSENHREGEEERDQYFGLSLRELIHDYKHLTLVLFKCALLQPKMLFFGSQCEHLCMIQFALVSLIPGLIRNLQDCADPAFNSYADNLVKPTSCKTSDRSSLLAYMGLPLQLFGAGSLFGPYTPLQQLDLLADYDTKSYIVGSTNSLLLQQKDRYSDILVNLDENTFSITSTSLRAALTLSTPDRRWIDFLTQAVNDTWDEDNPTRPKTMGYSGSEEFIRLQFEEYLLAFLSAVKYRQHTQKHHNDPKALLSDVDGDPANEFNSDFVHAWMQTENYKLWSRTTEENLFDIVEPVHPCTGGLTIEDVQRRLASQIKELGLDERVKEGKEVLGRAAGEMGKAAEKGRENMKNVMEKVWADIEVMREAQRKRAEENRKAEAERIAAGGAPTGEKAGLKVPKAPDFSSAQASMQAASSRAGAYFSSWSSWAAEKRKTGWGAGGRGGGGAVQSSTSPNPSSTTSLPSRSVPSTPTLNLARSNTEKRDKTGTEVDHSSFELSLPNSPTSTENPGSPREGQGGGVVGIDELVGGGSVWK